MKIINVIIADDHRLIRDGLRSLIGTVKDIKVLGEAANGDELNELLASLDAPPEIILMDIRFQEHNGIDLTRQVLKQYPSIRVIALTMYESEQYITGMLQAGAAGYMLKNVGKQELLQALRSVAEGQNYFSEVVTNTVMAKYMSPTTTPDEAEQDTRRLTEMDNVHLTRREKEILKLIVSEMTNPEIAKRLHISPRTVETHRRNLIHKLGVKNTVGLIKFAMHAGLYN
jgi:DNA-binding NarL/FixJ family response regulator